MRTNKNIKMNYQTAILLGVFLVACLVGAFFLYLADHGEAESQKTSQSDRRDMVEIGGIKCVPRQNLETYLFMGIDDKGKVEASSDYDGTGQSDVLILFVIDRVENTYAVLPINRDTITDVKSLDDSGNVLATTKIQIALAHANGDRMEQGCLNSVDAVSNLLYGQKIDGYVSLNMGAIAKLNHLVGGVTVTIEDDFSESDRSLKKGKTVRLSDEQAVHFVHDRINVGDGTNECRMRRQNAYMQGLKKIVSSKNEVFVKKVFDGLKEYMVTSLTGDNVSRISKAILKNKDLGRFEIKGTNSIDEYGYNAFEADEKSLEELVRTLFYDKI